MVERGDGPGDSRGAAPTAAFTESWNGTVVVVSVIGVLDMFTAPQLDAAISAALNRGPSGIVVDLCGLDMLASAGMNTLIDAQEKASPTPFAVAADGAATSRVMMLLGVDDILNLHPTLAAAMAGVTGD